MHLSALALPARADQSSTDRRSPLEADFRNSHQYGELVDLRRNQMSNFYFIKSKLDGNVIDISGGSTKSGASLDAYPTEVSRNQ